MEGTTSTTNSDLLESLAGALQKINNNDPQIILHQRFRLRPGPTESYLQVLKLSKALSAAMILNVLLSTMGCEVEITTSMANTIKTGNFRANSLQIAHPFSIFNVPYIDAAQMSCFNQTELDLLQSEGEGIPKEIVKKLYEN
jgi:hypothetical protein